MKGKSFVSTIVYQPPVLKNLENFFDDQIDVKEKMLTDHGCYTRFTQRR